MNKLYILLILLSFIVSCNSKPEALANKICSCLTEAGLKSGMSPENIGRNWNRDLTCIKEIEKELYDIVNPMNDEERAAFFKELTLELIETQCGDMLFKMIPYDLMIKQIESIENIENEFGIRLTLCDCIKLKDKYDSKEEAEKALGQKYVSQCLNLMKNASIKEIEKCK